MERRESNFLYVDDECNFYSAESLPRVCNNVNKVHTVTVRDIFIVKSLTRLLKKVSILYLQDNFLMEYYKGRSPSNGKLSEFSF